MAILSTRAQKGIVSHCFPVNAGRVRGGSMVGEERRRQGQKWRPAELCHTWLWLLTDLGQEGRDRPLTSPLLPSSLTHSSGSGYVQELGPGLSISFLKFSRTKASPCFSGDCAWIHQISSPDFSLQLHWCFTLFLLLQLTGSNSKVGYSILLNWYPLVTAMLFKRDMLLACYLAFLGTSLYSHHWEDTSYRHRIKLVCATVHSCSCPTPGCASTSSTTDVLKHRICTMN